MARGIAPSLLAAQVASTAAWALAGEGAWRDALREAASLEASPGPGADLTARLRYLRTLLAAHFTTVATIVPTDVDSHIRFHFWWGLEDIDALRAAIAVVDETDDWDPRTVSGRTLSLENGSLLSGHDGEWLAVRAGALGRALALGDVSSANALTERIDAEVARESAAYSAVRDAPGRELDALRIATLIAHNLGDLSRVVAAWPAGVRDGAELRGRLTRLGHDPASLTGEAGRVNKAVMADENHRYLPLRAARPLRRGLELVIPFGPFFDPWGATLARSALLDDRDRAAVLAVLLDAHEASPALLAYLRALAGLHQVRGGLERLAREHLPARAKKQLSLGSIRDALRASPEAVEARLVNRYRAARK